jgi:hypothetical protein
LCIRTFLSLFELPRARSPTNLGTVHYLYTVFAKRPVVNTHRFA